MEHQHILKEAAAAAYPAFFGKKTAAVWPKASGWQASLLACYACKDSCFPTDQRLHLAVGVKRLNLKEERPRQGLVLVWNLIFLSCYVRTSTKLSAKIAEVVFREAV